jgi:hypothetical protein
VDKLGVVTEGRAGVQCGLGEHAQGPADFLLFFFCRGDLPVCDVGCDSPFPGTSRRSETDCSTEWCPTSPFTARICTTGQIRQRWARSEELSTPAGRALRTLTICIDVAVFLWRRYAAAARGSALPVDAARDVVLDRKPVVPAATAAEDTSAGITRTISFRLDGQSYAIELSDESATEMREALGTAEYHHELVLDVPPHHLAQR